MASALRASVTHYIDHLEDAAWVGSLVAEHGLAAILEACVDALGARNPTEIHEVTTLLRDMGIGVVLDDELAAKVRELMPAGVLPALRALLRAPVLEVRMAAIYTIGKLSFPEEAEALRAAFPSYLDRDPLCLVRLLGELAWLGDQHGARARLEQVIAHESYLVRWSALGYLDSWGALPGSELHALKAQWLRTLSADPAPVIAAEARHQLAELESQVTGRERSTTLTFSMLEIRFLNELSRRKQADYTLEDLDTFVSSLALTPAPPA